MKKLLIAVVILSAALVSCNGGKKIASFSDKDSLSYAIGIDYGMHAKRVDSTMNVSIIAQAIADAMHNKPQMTHEDAYEFLNEWFSVRLPAKNKAESEAFLQDVKKKNPNVKETETGLMYEILDEGDMNVRAVNDADQVKVNYKGTLKDGFVFDQNDSIQFALNRVIKGWTEGLKLVGKGGQIVLWVPSDLGYGPQQQGQIPANSALKFEVDLIDVIPAEPAQ